MARARNIKPAFFKNEDLAELGFDRRLLFIGLWCLADREGRLEDRPKRIKMEIFPGDSVDVDKALDDLAKAGFILRYTVGEARLIQVHTFLKHQNPHHREPPSTIPKPGADPGLQPTQSPGPTADGKAAKPEAGPGSAVLIPDSLIPDSGSLNPESPSLKPEARGKTKGARFALPEWVPPEAWTDFEAMRQRIRKPMTDRAKELVIAKLDTLRSEGHTPTAVLEQSVLKGWQDVYPISAQPANGKASDVTERNRQRTADWVPPEAGKVLP